MSPCHRAASTALSISLLLSLRATSEVTGGDRAGRQAPGQPTLLDPLSHTSPDVNGCPAERYGPGCRQQCQCYSRTHQHQCACESTAGLCDQYCMDEMDAVWRPSDNSVGVICLTVLALVIVSGMLAVIWRNRSMMDKMICEVCGETCLHIKRKFHVHLRPRVIRSKIMKRNAKVVDSQNCICEHTCSCKTPHASLDRLTTQSADELLLKKIRKEKSQASPAVTLVKERRRSLPTAFGRLGRFRSPRQIENREEADLYNSTMANVKIAVSEQALLSPAGKNPEDHEKAQHMRLMAELTQRLQDEEEREHGRVADNHSLGESGQTAKSPAPVTLIRSILSNRKDHCDCRLRTDDGTLFEGRKVRLDTTNVQYFEHPEPWQEKKESPTPMHSVFRWFTGPWPSGFQYPGDESDTALDAYPPDSLDDVPNVHSGAYAGMEDSDDSYKFNSRKKSNES